MTRQYRRNMRWEILYRLGGRTPLQIARASNSAHPAVYAVLRAMGIRFASSVSRAA